MANKKEFRVTITHAGGNEYITEFTQLQALKLYLLIQRGGERRINNLIYKSDRTSLQVSKSLANPGPDYDLDFSEVMNILNQWRAEGFF